MDCGLRMVPGRTRSGCLQTTYADGGRSGRQRHGAGCTWEASKSHCLRTFAKVLKVPEQGRGILMEWVGELCANLIRLGGAPYAACERRTLLCPFATREVFFQPFPDDVRRHLLPILRTQLRSRAPDSVTVLRCGAINEESIMDQS